MPISFIILGLSVMYVTFFHMHKYSNVLLTISLLTLSSAFLTKTLSVTNYFGINIMGLIGYLAMFLWFIITKQVKFYVVVKCMLIAILYVVLFKFNSEYHYLFNYLPLCACVIGVALFSRGITDACATVFGSMFLISVTSIYLSRSNLWYATLADEVIISLTTYCCVALITMWLLVRFISFVANRRVLQ